eukprot:XP_001707960.1 Hypothetical protein GL50803_35682 [Giardia lamblia ATCC 50803]
MVHLIDIVIVTKGAQDLFAESWRGYHVKYFTADRIDDVYVEIEVLGNCSSPPIAPTINKVHLNPGFIVAFIEQVHGEQGAGRILSIKCFY